MIRFPSFLQGYSCSSRGLWNPLRPFFFYAERCRDIFSQPSTRRDLKKARKRVYTNCSKNRPLLATTTTTRTANTTSTLLKKLVSLGVGRILEQQISPAFGVTLFNIARLKG
ncbi:unnamed protein product, partial [Ectocarpus sp. 8 AP-2014]